ncbi:MAG: hypothetical protein R3208_02345 [Ketobacteraceae bacterium]|nr:hypothetical protein [Ketobacteraceae bacterium]
MVFKTKWGFYAFMLLILVVAAGSWWFAPDTIGPLQLSPATVLSLLGTIFVVTLFVERAQEVILTNWRAFGSEALDLRILALQRSIDQEGTDHPERGEAVARLETLKLDKLRYRAQTRIYALRIGVLMGIAVSLAGLRTLGALVPEAVWLDFGAVQRLIFHTVDVIITAGVIAGGSDGVHKMAELYRATVESRSRAKAAV